MQHTPAGRLGKKGDKSRDSLTGVLTKSAAEAQIASKMREQRGGALFLCDVDGIKQINERYGYLAGDECLKQTAQILSYMIHPNDILGRRSGAEFVMFMPDGRDAQQAEEYVRRINNRFCAGGERGSGKIPPSLTIAWVLRETEGTCGMLLERADAEMERLHAELKEAKRKKGTDHYIKDIRQVRKELLEQIKRPGAYCPDYETFKGIYHFLARGLIRNGQKACVILITVVNEEGGSPRLNEKDELMERLGEEIGNALRIGDVYARYSSSQYLLLVINAAKQQADMIADRIREQFLAGRRNNDVLIHHCYELQPARIGETAGR